MEIALKTAFHNWRNRGLPDKRRFVCLRQGYHGETLGALAVTDVQIFRDADDPLLMRSHQVMSPDVRQALPGESAADVAHRKAAELQALLEARQGEIAALILEPLVQGAAGMAMYDPAYLRAHSYTGNALACRAALAVLDRFDQDDVLAPLHCDSRIEHFRHLGMVWAFDVRESVAGALRGPHFASFLRVC